jgi:hypothetical protein
MGSTELVQTRVDIARGGCARRRRIHDAVKVTSGYQSQKSPSTSVGDPEIDIPATLC